MEVQIYAKMKQTTIDKEYLDTYAVIEQQLESPQEETMSLLDFGLMNDTHPAITPKSAT
jgi:hypothetical protein